MKIQKRDGQLQEFEGEKIAQAIRKAFRSTGTLIEESVLKEIIEDITKAAAADKPMLSVEVVQDLVEEELMQHQFYKEAIHLYDCRSLQEIPKALDASIPLL